MKVYNFVTNVWLEKDYHSAVRANKARIEEMGIGPFLNHLTDLGLEMKYPGIFDHNKYTGEWLKK